MPRRKPARTTISQVPVALRAPLILRGLLQLEAPGSALHWESSSNGVERCWLYRESNDGPAAALIRFQPGASVPEHLHVGFEHILVLSGAQTDGRHKLRAGDLMIHPPGTRHRIRSAEGCLVLAIYEKAVCFTQKRRREKPE